MLNYQKNTLLSLLANFKARLYDSMVLEENANSGYSVFRNEQEQESYKIIDRNLTSIEKQLKKL